VPDRMRRPQSQFAKSRLVVPGRHAARG
jgi:hypothetical protein